ncbi:olfactory receptor 4F15-like [Rhynchonycteris naso]
MNDTGILGRRIFLDREQADSSGSRELGKEKWKDLTKKEKKIKNSWTRTPANLEPQMTETLVAGNHSSVSETVGGTHLVFGGATVLLVVSVFCFASTDTYKLSFMVTSNNGFISLRTFFILILSYVFILVIVWQCCSYGLSKALSILSAHIAVVVLFTGLYIFVYPWPFPTVPVDTFFAIFFIITPFLNPAIYTFRNKEIKVAMRRIFSQVLSFGKLY